MKIMKIMNEKELLSAHFKELLERAKGEQDAETCISYTECALKVFVVMNQIDESNDFSATSLLGS